MLEGRGGCPTAGDMDRDPDEPVGDGVGLIACGFVAAPVLIPELSLLFWAVVSCKEREREEEH